MASTFPHGVVCGTLVGAETRVNSEKLRTQRQDGHTALTKYAKIGALLSGKAFREEEIHPCCDLLIERIDGWIEKLAIPRLSRYGIRASDLDTIAGSAGNKNNPVRLSADEIKDLVSMRL